MCTDQFTASKLHPTCRIVFLLCRNQHFNIIILLLSFCFGVLPTFIWSVPVEENNGQGVTVLISTIHFHRPVYAFILVQWCFVKWKEYLSAVCKGKWKCMQSTLCSQSTLSLNKTICSSFVCSGGVSLSIQIYHLTLVEFSNMYCYYT